MVKRSPGCKNISLQCLVSAGLTQADMLEDQARLMLWVLG